MDVTGKGAVVVGGASGMGRATAERLAEKGARVAVVDREGSDGAKVAADLGGLFFGLDITDHVATEQVLGQATDQLGSLHVAVTTAGGGVGGRTLGKDGPFPLEDFQRLVDLNLVATFNISRLSAMHMARNAADEEGERGVIINTSSIAAFEGQIGQVAYTATKAAIAGMALVMARDLGSLGIRSMAIAPSLFATGITAGIPEERAAQITRDAAFPRRMGRPDEYARLAMAIVDNPMLNGQCLRLDAGTRFAPR
jgi:NAD(P)-dependent dehydrogenase (short-subunit alcohol dehydrogenase family)